MGKLLERNIWYKFVLLRLFSVVLIQTWFVPDEYWQLTEVSHRYTFGYGYLTWEWREAIRSVIYPGIISFFFYMTKFIHVDYSLILIHLPRVLHALLFSVGDFFIWKLSRRLYGLQSAGWTGICLASSWFLMYCAPRTLSSCVEMALGNVALYLFPWDALAVTTCCSYLWFVALSCTVRPTAAILFFPLCMSHLYQCRSRLRLIWNYFLIGSCVLSSTFVLDSYYYGRVVFVPWNFITFNIFSGQADHYGVQPWHWYLSQGLPVTLGIYLLPVIFGAVKNWSRHQTILIPVLFTVIIYSCLNHKEFRFLLPLLPLLMCIAGDCISSVILGAEKKGDTSFPWSFVTLLALIIPNLLAVVYLGLIHQRGPLDVMDSLKGLFTSYSAPSVLFLMPCHSTPFYSHIHLNISMRFLTCEPNLMQQNNYIDEADIFYQNPIAWLESAYPDMDDEFIGPKNEYDEVSVSGNNFPPPTHVVLFDALLEKINGFLSRHNYRECLQQFNSHFSDGRKSQFIYVFCL